MGLNPFPKYQRSRSHGTKVSQVLVYSYVEGEGMKEGREREGMEEGRGKETEGMGGTEEDMGWDEEGRERERRKGREREERGYSPQTSIPGAATAKHHCGWCGCSGLWGHVWFVSVSQRTANVTCCCGPCR